MKSQNSVFQKSPYLWWQISKNLRFYFVVIPRWIWDRATKGYCRKDLWDLSCFYEVLFAESIADLAKITDGYPYKLKNLEEWEDILSAISQSFDRIWQLERDESYWNEEDGTINKEVLARINNEIETRKDDAFDLMKKWFLNLGY